MNKEASKIHFHSFDAFRFFAFLKVFIFHVPLILATNSSPFKQWYSDHIRHGGGVGVSFFFVLSGFLITYILTYEKLQGNRINLKRFFARRAFRIWPLFFLVVIFALLIPTEFAQEWGFHTIGGGYDPDWRFSLTFTENYKSILMDNGPKTTPLSVFWSLCIEEHFYILWMLAFFFIKRRFIPYFLMLTVVVAWVFRAFHFQIYNTQNVVNHDLFTNLDYFSISGLLGYVVAVNYEKVANFVMRIPAIYRLGYVLFVGLFLLFQKSIFLHDNYFLVIFKYTIYSIIFTLLLLMFIPQNGSFKIKNSNVFSKLGRISYGLYVYHMIWVHVILKIFTDKGIVLDNWSAYSAFVGITFGGTLIMSIISYRYFEIPILRLREKWFPNK